MAGATWQTCHMSGVDYADSAKMPRKWADCADGAKMPRRQADCARAEWWTEQKQPGGVVTAAVKTEAERGGGAKEPGRLSEWPEKVWTAGGTK